MLSKRQRVILAYILYAEPSLKSETLAEIVHISNQTLQSEINSINYVLEGIQAEIEVSEKGYYIITDEKKAAIIHFVTDMGAVDTSNTDQHVTWERILTIIGILLFEESFISMEELAGKLFVSKSTVNLHIKEAAKVINRTKGLHLTVSKIRGIHLEGNEKAKRFLLSKIILQGLDISRVVHLYDDTKLYPNFDSKEIEKTIRKLFVEHQVIISGRAFETVTAELTVCIVRNSLGYKITEDAMLPPSLLPLTIEIDKQMKQMGIYLNKNDLHFMEKTIVEQEKFYDSTRRNKEDIEIVDLLIEEIKEICNLDLKKDETFRNQLLFFLHQMHQRIQIERAYTNFYKRQINSLFPMAATLINHCRRSWLEKVDYLPESELAYITLFIGGYIEAMEEPLRILLVSNENNVLINWFENEIKRIAASRKVEIVQVIPKYLYDESEYKQLEHADAVVTTEMIEAPKPVVYIHTLFKTKEKEMFEEQLIHLIAAKKRKALNTLQREVLHPDYFSHVPKQLKTVEACVEHMLDQADLTNLMDKQNLLESGYISNDSKAALFSIFTSDEINSCILIGNLEKQLQFKTSPVKTVIISIYNVQDKKALLFYEMVKQLLGQAQAGRLSKVKSYQELESLFL
ncbi:helix-turn-helix domain-containing protein [Oceanobacillus sojae]|uniref:BglG family transcription antiterminator n=1 Tax=Oceanobacillus sojae TaxID=582851 RepID=UPI0021A2C7A1|nr:helix-turn-helix domain-containing protein [Oceanobacillus sojae]MCT1902001.1 helix-turn-helix domain-containing protein [Oceanobacillus sojae]